MGQHGNNTEQQLSSSHRVVVPCPPDVYVVASHFLLEVAVLQAAAPGLEEQPHLDGVAHHGEALASQAHASWKQKNQSQQQVRAGSCSQLSALQPRTEL